MGVTPRRIVSLVPSATETLEAWGRTPVACTRFCERPDLPHVGGTKDPDVAAIVELAPDLVVVDSEENRLEDHDALVEHGVRVHVLRVRSVHDLDAQLGSLAERLDARWVPLGPLPDPPVRLRVAVPIWKRPWMWLGAPTYGTSLLRSIGVDNVLAAHGPYPSIELDDVAEASPEAVFAPDEPYRFGERHRAEFETLAPAAFLDGQDLVWWGARTRAARTRLAAVVDELLS